MPDTPRPGRADSWQHRRIAQVAATEVERARGATIQVLFGPDHGMTRFYTRCFTLAPGGAIPAHRHPDIEHQQVVLEGEMVIWLDGEQRTVAAGDCLYIPPRVAHAYANRATVATRFICVVPASEHYAVEWLDDEGATDGKPR